MAVKIVVGSRNPVKVGAVKTVMSQMFPTEDVTCEGMSAPSEVAEQPMTAEETLLGARNRVRYCRSHTDADFYVAIEGGVDNFSYGPATFAYVVIADADADRESVGRSANLPLPQSVYRALSADQELGSIMDGLFGTTNVKQQGGAIGLLTNGLQTRQSAYQQALTLAMAPFLHGSLYEHGDASAYQSS